MKALFVELEVILVVIGKCSRTNTSQAAVYANFFFLFILSSISKM